MFKQICTTSVLCIVASLSYAQQQVRVKIIDTEGRNLIGATVTSNNQIKETNQQGIATLELSEKSSKNIAARYIGYLTANSTWDAKSTELTIILSKSYLQADEALVVATRAKENAATTFKNISKEELKKNNLGQDIPYLLDQTPGVIIGSDAGAGVGYTNMTIRGSDNQRINVTLNGIPLNDAESMGSFFINIPDFASSVESIQVQRGIGTSTNGAGAFGASLNIQTGALESKPYAELNNSFGTYNTIKNTVKAGTGLIQNKYAFNTRLSRIASDGYVERASSDLKSFYVDGGLYTNKHTLKATVFSGKEKTYQAWYGTPEPLLTGDKVLLEKYANEAFGLYSGSEYDRLMQADRRYNYYNYDNQTDNYTQTHSHLQYSNIINEKLKFNTALHYTKGAGYYEEYRENNKFSDYNLPNVVVGDETISRTDLVRQRWLDNHFYGLVYSLDYKIKSNWNIIAGGGYNQYIGDHYGKVIWAKYASTSQIGDKYYLNDAQKNDFNIYVKTDYRANKWLFNVDVQYRNVYYKAKGDDNKVKAINFKDNLNFINPKLGLTYFVTPLSNLYASYAYASKEPVRKDYIENPRNTFPKPERMQNIELGYRFSNDVFNLGTNFYAMLYKDQLIPTGSLNDTGAELRMNIPKSHRIGIEVDAGWRISDKLSWLATAAISDNKIFDFIEYYQVYDSDWNWLREKSQNLGNTKIAKSAAAIFSNNFSYRPINKLEFSLLSKYVSRQYLDNTEAKERSIAPYFINNMRATYSFAALGLQQIDCNLQVNNIFNREYSTSGYTWGQKFENRNERDYYNFYSPQATRHLLLGFNIRF